MKKENLDKDFEDEIDEENEDNGPDDEEEEEGKEEGGEEEHSTAKENGADDSEDSEPDPEIEAKRERRRAERKARKERERREKIESQRREQAFRNELKAAREEINNLKSKFSTQETSAIDAEMAECSRIYDQASAVYAAAITEGDGQKAADAKKLQDRAFIRYGKLQEQKQAMQQATKEPVREEARQEEERQTVSKRTLKLVNDWKINNPWFDDELSDRDSRVADLISQALIDEGYDTDEKEYWDELTERCKVRLPHQFKTKTKSAGGPPVGGSGRESLSGSIQEKRLPQEFVKTLNEAYGDDPVKRKAAIKNYLASQAKGAR